MIMLKGTIRDGQVVLPQQADIPDGTAVTVLTHDHSSTLESNLVDPAREAHEC
jgi:hypothetical protein